MVSAKIKTSGRWPSDRNSCKCLTYASVVSRETVVIALTLAALNDLQVKGSDVLSR